MNKRTKDLIRRRSLTERVHGSHLWPSSCWGQYLGLDQDGSSTGSIFIADLITDPGRLVCGDHLLSDWGSSNGWNVLGGSSLHKQSTKLFYIWQYRRQSGHHFRKYNLRQSVQCMMHVAMQACMSLNTPAAVSGCHKAQGSYVPLRLSLIHEYAHFPWCQRQLTHALAADVKNDLGRS